tara:strand:- start:166 stop:414 length:249 start_codon:yes stop_codon:yes gene_type:complete
MSKFAEWLEQRDPEFKIDEAGTRAGGLFTGKGQLQGVRKKRRKQKTNQQPVGKMQRALRIARQNRKTYSQDQGAEYEQSNKK